MCFEIMAILTNPTRRKMCMCMYRHSVSISFTEGKVFHSEFQINTWWRMRRGDLMAYTWFIGSKEDDFIIQTETLDSQRTH